MSRRKKIVAAVSLTLVVGIAVAAGILIWRVLENDIRTPEAFKAYIKSFGWKGYLVALGLQILQVFVAIIPGEVVEIGAGVSFGWFGGTLICMAGCAIASAGVFFLVKTAGMKAVSFFVDPARINNLRFLNNDKKLDRTVFLLFFIPGTPKDLLTYFIGLTRMKFGNFIAISTVARLPSLVSSTIGGSFVSNGNYLAAIIIFVSTAAVSICGIMVYKKILAKHNKKKGVS